MPSSSGARTDRGFTLVEILIAIVLVGILSAVVVVGVGNLTSKGSAASCAASADAARAAATVHLTTTGSHPTNLSSMVTSKALDLGSGVTLDATGMVASGNGWSMGLILGSGATPPTFACSSFVLPAGFWMGPNGHGYRLNTTGATWADAVTAAAAAAPGAYLVTVTSAAESAFLLRTFGRTLWIAGTDAAVEGTWIWTTGPEANTTFWIGNASGSAVNGAYTAWGTSEPNDLSGQDCVDLWSSGPWDDQVCTTLIASVAEIGT